MGHSINSFAFESCTCRSDRKCPDSEACCGKETVFVQKLLHEAKTCLLWGFCVCVSFVVTNDVTFICLYKVS